MSPKYLAVDIVILFSNSDNEKIKSCVNSTEANELILDCENHLPHLSLYMGIIEEQDLQNSKNILEKISETTSSVPLELNTITTMTLESGIKIHSGDITINNALIDLHEEVSEKFKQIFRQITPTSEMFLGGEPNKITLDWVKNYSTISANSKFSPHITLGDGSPDTTLLPINLKASSIALCRLSNYCTCTKIIEKFDLSQKDL